MDASPDPTMELPHVCPACRIIDAADGASDGHMGLVPLPHVRSENSLVSLLRRAEDQTADRITNFAGSMRFVYAHTIWFSVWILGNLGLAGLGFHFDRFPFGLLTMIVSLEAIFLATFVMISQNRQAARSDLRAQLDFENNLRGEIWSVHIGQALGIDVEHVESVVAEVLRVSEARLHGHPVH
jgi:uncharacterized membrane protein